MQFHDVNLSIKAAAATMLALVTIPANAAVLAPVEPVFPKPPPRTTPTTPGERLAQGVRNMFTLIEKPNPKYATFISIGSKTRLILVSGKNGLRGRFSAFEGEAARTALTNIFGPKSGVHVVFGEPDIRVEGVFAQLTIKFVEQKDGKQSGCSAIYINAMREYDNWNFTEMVIAPSYPSRGCPTP
jgi:hypothetical protein